MKNVRSESKKNRRSEMVKMLREMSFFRSLNKREFKELNKS